MRKCVHEFNFLAFGKGNAHRIISRSVDILRVCPGMSRCTRFSVPISVDSYLRGGHVYRNATDAFCLTFFRFLFSDINYTVLKYSPNPPHCQAGWTLSDNIPLKLGVALGASHRSIIIDDIYWGEPLSFVVFAVWFFKS